MKDNSHPERRRQTYRIWSIESLHHDDQRTNWTINSKLTATVGVSVCLLNDRKERGLVKICSEKNSAWININKKQAANWLMLSETRKVLSGFGWFFIRLKYHWKWRFSKYWSLLVSNSVVFAEEDNETGVHFPWSYWRSHRQYYRHHHHHHRGHFLADCLVNLGFQIHRHRVAMKARKLNSVEGMKVNELHHLQLKEIKRWQTNTRHAHKCSEHAFQRSIVSSPSSVSFWFVCSRKWKARTGWKQSTPSFFERISIGKSVLTRFTLIHNIQEAIFIFDYLGIVQICFHSLHHQGLKESRFKSENRKGGLLRHRKLVWHWPWQINDCLFDVCESFHESRRSIDGQIQRIFANVLLENRTCLWYPWRAELPKRHCENIVYLT